MIDATTIGEAVKLLREAVPGGRVFLFGSYGRGEANDQSDLDLLVVEPEVGTRQHEVARLTRIVSELGVRPDILVISQATFEQWQRTPGMILPEPRPVYRGVATIRFGIRIWTWFSREPVSG